MTEDRMDYLERRVDRMEQRQDRHGDTLDDLGNRMTKQEASRGTMGHLIAGGISVLAVVVAVVMPIVSPEKEAKVIYVTEDEVAKPVKAKVDGAALDQAEAYSLDDGTTVLRSGGRRWFVRSGWARRADGTQVPVQIEATE